jgi:RNA polymerase sigma factor (TIGR02999 family)
MGNRRVPDGNPPGDERSAPREMLDRFHPSISEWTKCPLPVVDVPLDGAHANTLLNKVVEGRMVQQGEVTQLLSECSRGESDAFDRLIPLVYEDLRRIAHKRLRAERAGHTLGTTAVVHEAYLQLVDQATATWRDRAHFFAVAARVIRHVLVDYARRRGAQKRGGGALRLPLREELTGSDPQTVELLALEQALNRLARYDPRLERVVECRFFGGMTMEDTATALGVSQRTAERDWTRAKAYLYQALGAPDPA